MIGGYLKDIPLPHRYKWPGTDEQREVRAQISHYAGSGGRRYYASMEQERNPIWDASDAAEWGRPGEPKGWTGCWDDKEHKGAMLTTRPFDTHVQAMLWFDKMMRERFPDHEITVSDFSSKYYAKYEGD